MQNDSTFACLNGFAGCCCFVLLHKSLVIAAIHCIASAGLVNTVGTIDHICLTGDDKVHVGGASVGVMLLCCWGKKCMYIVWMSRHEARYVSPLLMSATGVCQQRTQSVRLFHKQRYVGHGWYSFSMLCCVHCAISVTDTTSLALKHKLGWR